MRLKGSDTESNKIPKDSVKFADVPSRPYFSESLPMSRPDSHSMSN